MDVSSTAQALNPAWVPTLPVIHSSIHPKHVCSVGSGSIQHLRGQRLVVQAKQFGTRRTSMAASGQDGSIAMSNNNDNINNGDSAPSSMKIDREKVLEYYKASKEMKTLEEVLEEDDDIIMDRSPLQKGKVYMFGAWLDEGYAGRKAVAQTPAMLRKSKEKQRILDGATDYDLNEMDDDDMKELGDNFFNQAVNLYNSGRYKESIGIFTKAIEFGGGAGARTGGEYALWQAQAFHAMGDSKRSNSIFTTLRRHPDGDIRKVAEELQYILTAPKLELGENTLFRFEPLKEELRMKRKGRKVAASAKPAYAVMEKEPDKYSLDWFLSRPQPPKMQSDTQMTMLAVGGGIVALAMMVLLSL